MVAMGTLEDEVINAYNKERTGSRCSESEAIHSGYCGRKWKNKRHKFKMKNKKIKHSTIIFEISFLVFKKSNDFKEIIIANGINQRIALDSINGYKWQ